MARVTPFTRFEKPRKDKEPRGMKEGSRKEGALDRRQGGGFPPARAKRK